MSNIYQAEECQNLKSKTISASDYHNINRHVRILYYNDLPAINVHFFFFNCVVLTVQCKGSRSRIRSENNGDRETQHGDKDADRGPGAGYAGTGTQNHEYNARIYRPAFS
jgi:hypothetical protein